MRSQSNQNESFFLNQQHFVSIDLWDFITTFEVWRHDQGESVKKFKQHLLNKWVSRQAQQCLGPWVHKRWLWFQILHTVTLPPVQTQALQGLSHILQNPIGGAEQLQKLIRRLALGRPHPVWTGICGELLPLYVQQYQWLCHLQESPVGACHSSCRCCSWNMKGLPQASCLIEELVPGWGWLCWFGGSQASGAGIETKALQQGFWLPWATWMQTPGDQLPPALATLPSPPSLPWWPTPQTVNQNKFFTLPVPGVLLHQ